MGRQSRGKKEPRTKAARVFTSAPIGLVTPEQAVARFGHLIDAPMRGNRDALDGLLRFGEGTALVDLLLPLMWAGVSEGGPSNICVDACMVLKHAYAQFGIRSEVRVVDLVVNQPGGRRWEFGSPTPSWSGEAGNVFNGHAVLALPDSARYVDPTVEQFEVVRRLNMGPLIGKAVGGTVSPTAGEDLFAPGLMFAAKRENLTLIYTIAEEHYSLELEERLEQYVTDGHRRAGANNAALALMMLRIPEVIERARKVPYPRLQALLDAVGDAPERNIDGDLHFMMPGPDGSTAPVTLDRIELG